jgi:hypothetical protein
MIVILGLSFFCKSVNVAVGMDMGEVAGVVLVTHPDKSNVTTNRETTITIRLAIKNAMAFHAETVRAAQRPAVQLRRGREPSAPHKLERQLAYGNHNRGAQRRQLQPLVGRRT